MKTFQLTEQHIALLRASYVRWEDCEYGAASIDTKRPYGNSSVEEDIAEILGMKPEGMEYGEPALTDEQRAKCASLHLETETALQIVLATGAFKPGTYEAMDYRKTWTLSVSAKGARHERLCPRPQPRARSRGPRRRPGALTVR